MRIARRAQAAAHANALPPKGCHPMFHFIPARRSWSHSLRRIASQTAAETRKTATTAFSERNFPSRIEVMVESASDRGRLQKNLSMSERWRKLCRLLVQAAT
jgi:hypothetical protein